MVLQFVFSMQVSAQSPGWATWPPVWAAPWWCMEGAHHLIRLWTTFGQQTCPANPTLRSPGERWKLHSAGQAHAIATLQRLLAAKPRHALALRHHEMYVIAQATSTTWCLI